MSEKLRKHLGSWYQFPTLVRVLEEKVLPELAKHKQEIIYPEVEKIFRAFRDCPASRLKVVILGQDPYHTPGMATGLCFDNPFPVKKMSPSLQNILKKIAKEPVEISMEGMEVFGSYLGHLPRQGVLMAAVSPQGESNKLNDEILSEFKARFIYVFTLFDNDDAGLAATGYFISRYGTIPLYYPYVGKPKDISDHYQERGGILTHRRIKRMLSRAFARTRLEDIPFN